RRARRSAGGDHAPRSAESLGVMLARGSPVAQLAADPRAAPGARDRRRPRAVPLAGLRARAAVPGSARVTRPRSRHMATLAPRARVGAARRTRSEPGGGGGLASSRDERHPDADGHARRVEGLGILEPPNDRAVDAVDEADDPPTAAERHQPARVALAVRLD